jgi:twitching motility protein PilT
MDENPINLALRAARKVNASDLHITTDQVPAIRYHGSIIRPGTDKRFSNDGEFDPIFKVKISGTHIREFLKVALEPVGGTEMLTTTGVADCAFDGKDDFGPTRVHAFAEASGMRIAIRLLAMNVPEFSTLGLPDIILKTARRQSGLILFCGPTGSGKSSAQAAVLQNIANDTDSHIITLEDPIEYRLRSARAIVSQVEVGPHSHVASFAEGLRGVLRSDPDVLLIGECRDPISMAAGIELAEQGRMVSTSVHARDASSVFDRIIGSFPGDAQPQVRVQLANAISLVVVLRLLPRKDGQGRVAACEVLFVTDAIRALIREDKPHEIRNAIISGKSDGSQTLESDLMRLVNSHVIDMDVARRAAIRPEELREGAASSDSGATSSTTRVGVRPVFAPAPVAATSR